MRIIKIGPVLEQHLIEEDEHIKLHLTKTSCSLDVYNHHLEHLCMIMLKKGHDTFDMKEIIYGGFGKKMKLITYKSEDK